MTGLRLKMHQPTLRLAALLALAALLGLSGTHALLGAQGDGAGETPEVGALQLPQGLSLVGWFGGPTTSAELLAANPAIQRIWSFDPDRRRWILDAPELPVALRPTIEIVRGSGFFVVAAHRTTLLVPLAGPPIANVCPRPSPVRFADPTIIVRVPTPGALVSSPLPLDGTAGVFNATIRIRIVAAGGAILADTFTTAAAAGPARSPFAADVAYAGSEQRPGCLQLFEESPNDGSLINEVQVPVILGP